MLGTGVSTVKRVFATLFTANWQIAATGLKLRRSVPDLLGRNSEMLLFHCRERTLIA